MIELTEEAVEELAKVVLVGDVADRARAFVALENLLRKHKEEEDGHE